MQADLSAEAHTELLWAFEGITSYYDELALVRSAVLPPEDYLDLFANSVTRVLRAPGHARQSIAESSFDAWTKFYKQDENAPNAIASYYTKGALVAFGLDVTLREASGDALCLDDLMRRLWQRYGRTAVGVPERAIERETADLLGQPLDEFFARFVYGTDELPLAEWFGRCGVGYRARAMENAEDLGGYRVEPAQGEAAPALGARFEAQPTGLRLTHVITGGAAHSAGLAPGDLLLAVDGERLTAANLADLLRRAGAAPAEVHFFRRDLLHLAVLAECRAALDTCDLWLLPDDAVDDAVRARRAAWLGTGLEGR
jgi:predicted metalloprotease with PDZ domain